MLPEIVRMKGHQAAPSNIAVLGRGRKLISTSPDLTLRIWDLTSGKLLHTVKDTDPGVHQEYVTWAASPDGELIVTSGGDFTTKVYSSKTGKRLRQLTQFMKMHYNTYNGVEFSADGKLLAAVMGKSIDIYETKDWSVVHKLQQHNTKIDDVEFANHAPLLATCGGKTVIIWNAETGKPVTTLKGFKKSINTIRFSPDDTILATAGYDKEVTLWSLPDGKRIGSYRDHQDTIFMMDFFKKGDWMVSSCRIENDDWRFPLTEIRIWNRLTYETNYTYQYNSDDCYQISSCGRWLAVPFLAFNNDPVHLIDLSTLQTIEHLPASEVVAFLPDSSGIITADQNDLVLWELPKRKPAAQRQQSGAH